MHALLLPLLASVPAAQAEMPVMLPPGVAAQAAAERLLDRFQAELMATPSATATLQRWCADELGVAQARVIAILDRGALIPATVEQRARLGVGADEPIGYRRVQLMCGGRTLSEADNWYVPSRLTSAMRAALAGDTPYGAVIAPLHPERRTLVDERLWSPPAAAAMPVLVPHALFRHRALVLDGSGHPLAEVAETYTSALLAGLSVR